MRIFLSLLLLAVLLVSCSLDSFLFNNESVKRYDLSTSVIPESNRAQWEFNSGGNTLYGYYAFPPDTLANGLTVLYCHGNKKQLGEYWDRVELLYKMGFRVFIFDYRGFGRSGGTSSQNSLYEDGVAALNLLRTQFQVDSSRLVLYGYSLGNVVSIYLAATQINPQGLIAEAPFASAHVLLQSATLLDMPGGYLLEGEFDNLQYIRQIRSKFLLLHGEIDDFVPYNENGRVVFENAPEPKDLALIPGANHTDIPQVMGTEAYSSLLHHYFFER